MTARTRIPWLLACCTVLAMGIGMVVEGPLDWVAVALLAAPLAVMIKFLVSAYRREG